MNCEICQSLLSDHLEGSLPAGTASELAGHLEGCADCRAQVFALRSTLEALRSVGSEPAPQGLADIVVARYAGATVEEVGGAAARLLRRRVMTWRVVAAAAVLCAFASFAFLFRRQADLAGQLAGAGEKAAAAEAALVALQRELSSSRSQAEERLRNESARLAAAQRQVSELVASGAALGERIGAVERESAACAEGRSRLEAALAATAAARVAADRQVEELVAQLQSLQTRPGARKEPRPSSPGEVQALPGEVTPEEEDATPPVAARMAVAFREVEGRLELRVQGPREEVIPELLARARDPLQGAAARLALNALENLLEVPAGEEARDGEGWLSDRLGGLKEVFGWRSAQENPEVSEDTATARRIEALERAWELELSGKSTGGDE